MPGRSLLPPSPARARIMSAIRGRGNKTTERAMAKALRKAGIVGWRRHARIAGRPDFIFPKYRLAIFVDGCFWHGCPTCYRPPRRNKTFWAEKLQRNCQRDRHVSASLRRSGWTVVRFWEHVLATPEIAVRRVEKSLARNGYRD